MSQREKILYAILAVIGAVSLAWAFLGPSGAREVARLKEEGKRLKVEVRELESKKEALTRQADLLRDDPRLIERRARDELGMVRSDETIIMIPGKKRDAD